MVLENKSKNVGILGLSFKKGTDDLRYSPVVELAENLLGKGFALSIYDKNVNLSMLSGTNKQFIDEHIPHLSELIFDDLDHVIQGAETIIITHDEPEFKGIDEKYPEKHFIDLVKIKSGTSQGNYEGICW